MGASGGAIWSPWLRIPTQLLSLEPCHSSILRKSHYYCSLFCSPANINYKHKRAVSAILLLSSITALQTRECLCKPKAKLRPVMKVLSEGFFLTLLFYFKNIQQGHGIVTVCGSMGRQQVLGNHLWKRMKEIANVDSMRPSKAEELEGLWYKLADLSAPKWSHKAIRKSSTSRNF